MDGRSLGNGFLAALIALATLAAPTSAQTGTQLSVRAPLKAVERIGPEWDRSSGLEVAADTATGEVVAVWDEDTDDMSIVNSTVRVARLSASGTVVGTPRTLTTLPANAAYPDIAYQAGVGALVVAQVGDAIVAQRLGTDLAPVGAAVGLATADRSAQHAEPHVAYDAGAERWVVVWRTQLYDGVYTGTAELRSRTVAVDGALGAARVVDAAFRVGPSLEVASNPAGDVVVTWTRTQAGYWSERTNVNFRRLDDGGAPLGERLRLTSATSVDSTGQGAYHGVAAWDGVRWIVAWSESNDPWPYGPTTIRAVRIASDGTLLDTAPTILGRHPSFPDWTRVHIAARPGADEVLVTWSEYEQIYGRGLSAATGAALDRVEGRLDHDPDPTWSGWQTFDAAPAAVPSGFLLVSDRVDRDRRHEHAGLWTREVAFGSAPDSAITSGPATPHKSPTGSVAFTAPTGATSACSLLDAPSSGTGQDRDHYVPCTSPHALALKPQRRYEVRVRSSWNGWTEATPALHTFTTDDFDPPATTFAWGPPRMTTARWAHFEFTSDEAAATFTCRLDGAAPVRCDSGVVDLEDLPVGEHVFSVAATEDGVTGPAADFRWTVFSIEQDDARGKPPTGQGPAAAAEAAPPAVPSTVAPAPAPSAAATTPPSPAPVLRVEAGRPIACTGRSTTRRCVAQRRLVARQRRAAALQRRADRRRAAAARQRATATKRTAQRR